MKCFEATKSTSKYEGVSWYEIKKLWQADFSFNGKTSKSFFENELDAAREINQLCENMGIPSKNFELLEIPNKQVTSIIIIKSITLHEDLHLFRAHESIKNIHALKKSIRWQIQL